MKEVLTPVIKPLVSCINHTYWVLAWLFFSGGTWAMDHGVFGETFPVAEKPMTAMIQARLAHLKQDGTLDGLQGDLKRAARRQVFNPTPIDGVTRAIKPHTRFIDPSLVIQEDIRDADGRILHPKGKRINPFDYISLSKTLVFIDAADADQVHWAKEFVQRDTTPAKVILVGGSPARLMKQWQRPVYFDQGGFLTRKFQITRVPATLSQHSNLIKIQEVAL